MPAIGNMGLRVTANGIEVQGYNEASNLDKSIRAIGSSVLSTHRQSLKYNGTEVLTASQLAATKGLILTIFNADFTLAFSATYDTTLSATLSSLVAKLKTIGDAQPFCLQSAGVFSSNAALDTQMKVLGSWEWRDADNYYNVFDYRYVGFGLGKIGFTTERHFFDDLLEPEAEITSLQDTSNDIGILGFGMPIERWIFPDNIVKIIPIAPKAGQHIIVSAVANVNLTEFIGGNSVGVHWEFMNDANAVLGSDTMTFGSCEVLEKQDKYSLVPTGTTQLKIWRTLQSGRMDFISVYFAGLSTPPAIASAKLSNHGLANNNLSLSPVSGSPFIPDSWAAFARSNSNLYWGTQIPLGVTGPVQWGNETLNSTTEKHIITTTASTQVNHEYMAVDHTMLHYMTVWVYLKDKTTGSIYFGAKAKNSDGNARQLIKTDTFTPTTNTYFQNPSISEIDTGSWVLMQGWLLPSQWTQQECVDFKAKNLHFFGYKKPKEAYDDKNNGIGNSDVIHGGMLQMTVDVASIGLRFLDWSNTATSTSMWAFPTLSVVNAAAWSANNTFTLNVNPD